VRTSPFSRGWRLRSSTQTSDSFTRSPIGGDLGRYKKKSARAGARQSSAIKPEVRAKSFVVNQSPPREIKPAQAVPVARLEAMASRRRTCFFGRGARLKSRPRSTMLITRSQAAEMAMGRPQLSCASAFQER
jgi:hypothetical protein